MLTVRSGVIAAIVQEYCFQPRQTGHLPGQSDGTPLNLAIGTPNRSRGVRRISACLTHGGDACSAFKVRASQQLRPIECQGYVGQRDIVVMMSVSVAADFASAVGCDSRVNNGGHMSLRGIRRALSGLSSQTTKGTSTMTGRLGIMSVPACSRTEQVSFSARLTVRNLAQHHLQLLRMTNSDEMPQLLNVRRTEDEPACGSATCKSLTRCGFAPSASAIGMSALMLVGKNLAMNTLPYFSRYRMSIAVG